MTDQQLVEYDITDAAIAEMSNVYLALTITDIEDKEQFDSVHDARMVVKNKRVEVEKKRKDLKKDALAWGKQVDTEAKRIFGLMLPIEDHLMTEEKKVIDEQNRIAEEAEEKARVKVQGRVDELLKLNCVKPFMDVAILTDEEYDTLLFDVQEDFKEQERIKAEEAEKAEVEKKRLSNQKKKQDKIAADQKIAQDKIDADLNAIAEEKARIAKVEADKIEAEEAIAKAEQDEKDRIEREAKDAADLEEKKKADKERQERLKDDKVRLSSYIVKLQRTEVPLLECEEAKNLLSDLQRDLIHYENRLENL